MNIINLHSSVWRRLQALEGRLPHAILLTGLSGLYKTELAYAFATSLLCENRSSDGTACGQCQGCQWHAQANHPDFRWLKLDSLDELNGNSEEEKTSKEKLSKEITIDQVRELGDFLTVGTHRNGYRVVLITPADAMNRNTANALLKALEEPRPETVFILTTDGFGRLLPTIVSRCQQIPVPVPDVERAVLWLEEQTVPMPEKWLARAGGAVRIADEIARGSRGGLFSQLEKRLEEGAHCNPINIATELEKTLKSDSRLSPADLINIMQCWVSDLVLAKNGLPLRYFGDLQACIIRLSRQTSIESCFSLQNELNGNKPLAKHPLNARLFIENLFFSYRTIFRTGT